ncbi:MAG: hypothetical protein OXH09_22345 [Gammaproteobacteria bacterium]|nr:hypothetical protein [Gammaproteobacteria bacterium]
MLDIIAHTTQVALGLCFGYAAVSKIMAYRGFEAGIVRFEVVPNALVRPAGLSVVGLELLVASSFLADHLRLFGIAVATALLVIFLAVMVSARRRGVVETCICFGANDGESAPPKTFLRIALLGIGVAIVGFDILLGADTPWDFWWATTIGAACVLVGCATLTEVPEVLAVATRSTHRVGLAPQHGRVD